MRIVSTDISLQGDEVKEKLGYNLLQGIIPEIRDEKGQVPAIKRAVNFIDEKDFACVAESFGESTHIDVLTGRCTITYDLGRNYDVDTIFVSGLWSYLGGKFMLADYELHVADSLDKMYTSESLVTHVDNRELVATKTERCSETFFYCGGVAGRFFGFKVNKACTADDIVRIRHLAVYNNTVTRKSTFLHETCGKNMLHADDIKFTTAYEGNLDSLVNGSVFDGYDIVSAENAEIILTATEPARYITLLGDYKDYEVYTAEVVTELWQSKAEGEYTDYPTDNTEICRKFTLAQKSKKLVGIKLGGKVKLQQMSLGNNYRPVDVELDHIKTKDFIGIGANDIPTAWMTESRMRGFRPVYWPIYRHRIEKSSPSVIRVWFQVDWIVDNEEDYMAGICNFESDKMRAFLKYLDVYEKAGIEVEFNFGWKAGTLIQDWYCIPEVNDVANREYPVANGLDRRGSAPRNFDGFAKCCASTVKELCENRGYTCIKHLTFYNEPDWGEQTVSTGDFTGYWEKTKDMWQLMLRSVHRELEAIGANKYVDYWVSEGVPEWIDYMMTECSDLIAMNTFHRYSLFYDDRLKLFYDAVSRAGEVGAAATEFAVYEDPTWSQSNVEFVMSMLHSGMRGGMYWILQGAMLTDPSWIYLNSKSTWWCAPYEEDATASENRSYHEFNLFTHYLPCHSKVLETTVYQDDIRVEVIETLDGNYSVFVESKQGKLPKDIEIKFSKALNKTFRKHIYKPGEAKLDGNLSVPPVVEEIEVNNTLSDTLDADYQLVCYTTLPAFKQVNMKEVFVKLPQGESYKIETELLDCEGELTYEIVSSTGGECAVDDNGVFRQIGTLVQGSKYCVKAALKADPDTYGITLIKIV